MRTLALLFLVPAIATAQVISWEKPIAPGLTYRMEVDSEFPRVIHALRWSQGAPQVTARSEVAQMRLFADAGSDAREGISSLLERSGAIAGINGDFFPTSGDPLNAVVRDGLLLSRPYPGRACFGWGSATSAAGLLEWSGSADISSIGMEAIVGLNEDVQPNRLVLFTDSSAEARAPTPNVVVVFKIEGGGFAPTGTVNGKVTEVFRNRDSVKIPQGHAILVKSGEDLVKMGVVMRNDEVTVKMKTTGMDWSKIDNVIGGGPMLLRGGNVAIDTLAAGFSKTFADTRHPRTAIGRTGKGDIWFVTVDGRQPMSNGASLEELAAIMQARGCTDATNLDGGGSTTLAIFGQVMNRPSDGVERKVANGVLFFGPKPTNSLPQVVIQGPAVIEPGSVGSYWLVGSDGRVLPNLGVLWTATGPGGWIDQGGTLRPLDVGGQVTLRAFTKGITSSLTVNVTPKPAPKLEPKPKPKN
ncbi:MAG: phosphodiester glycosidase family protein [Chthonomonas sp.]|nr:phosphodiester glycosidase family protein [Chthonomonas sp.]